MAFWGLTAPVAIIDSLLLFVLEPRDVDEELLKQPRTLPKEEVDSAGDGGGVPTFPKQRSRT
jgi:hypothetical protein